MTSVLSVGSNVGDRRAHLCAAVDVVASMLPLVAVSPVYETEPVGGVEQDAFLNCVVVVDSDDAEHVFAAAQLAEQNRGRIRSTRWGPHTLDVDVIRVDALRRDEPRLTLPHPRAHERAFVLVPWLDVDPAAELPGHGRVRDLVRRLDTSGVRRWAG